jgi:AcrR family transcriptional regulator
VVGIDSDPPLGQTSASAEKLFMRDGYEPTTMLRIAAEARVAERTLYLAYPSKAALLGEIIRVGVRGGEGDQPLTRRAPWVEMLAAASVAEVVARFAAGGAALMSRAARALWLGEANAASDPQLHEARRHGHANIRADMAEFAAALRDRGALQSDLHVEQAAAILFAICANETIFLRLIDECGWTPDQYAELIEKVIGTLLVEPDPAAG